MKSNFRRSIISAQNN